jgi:hypothetical protein
MILTPKNWTSFQHYKDREPSWIKLHKGLLTNYEFICLPVASKALAPMLWLLASEYKDGIIDASLDKIAFRLSMSRGDLASALTPLIDNGFFDASETLAECKQDACLEKEIQEENIGKRERQKETREVALLFDPTEFATFWDEWPNKVGKPAAVKALAAARKRGVPFDVIMDGARRYIRDKPPDRPWLNPATFLNQNRWEDRPAPTQISAAAKPLTEYQRQQNEMKGILDELENFARGGSGSGEQNPQLLPDHSGRRSEGVRSGAGEAVIDLPRGGYRASG